MIERVFLGCERPLAESARRWLEKNRADGTWLVVETRAAVNRLARCEPLPGAESLRVIAAEDAAEALLPSFLSVDPLVRRQALWQALHEINEADCLRYFPSANQDENRTGWESAIDALDDLFSELTTAGFCAEDVNLLAKDSLPDDERHRWRILAQIEKAFLLFINGRIPKPEAPPRRLVLAALGDLPGRLRRWIGEHMESAAVVALIAADESEKDRFDELGAVAPRPWLDAHLPIGEDTMIVAASASAQAAAAYDAVERLQTNERLDLDPHPPRRRPPPAAGGGVIRTPIVNNVCVAALDEALTPFLDAEGCRRGFCKPQGARRLGRTAPYRLLHAVADYLEADGFRAFSALVRHPDFEETLEREPLEGCDGCSVAEALADLDDLAAGP